MSTKKILKPKVKVIDDLKDDKKDKLLKNIPTKDNLLFIQKEYGTEVDDDGQTDTDFNEELEDEYNVDELSDELEKEEDNIDDVIIDDYEGDDVEPNEVEDEVEVEADDVDDTVDDQADTVDEGGDDEGCLYNFSKKKAKKDFDSDDDYEEEFFDDDEIVEIDKESKFVSGNDRITFPVMTKYERVRILAERSKQLMLGAKPMLKNTENIHPKDIARLELEKGAIPYKIHRERPDGKVEEWHVNELLIVN